MTDIDIKIKEFWIWFSGSAESLASRLEDPELLGELDRHIRHLNPELSWEIGPGLSSPSQLVISPNLNRGLLMTTRLIISQAPSLPAWEFHSARQPKDWDYRLELDTEGQSVRLDASDWTFVLLQYPDGIREVLLARGKSLPRLNNTERWQAAAITLESILGEERLLERVDEFELVDRLEKRFEERQRSIQDLFVALQE